MGGDSGSPPWPSSRDGHFSEGQVLPARMGGAVRARHVPLGTPSKLNQVGVLSESMKQSLWSTSTKVCWAVITLVAG